MAVEKKPEPERGPVIRCSCGCGATLYQFDDSGRERKFLKGHALIAAYQQVKKEVLGR